MKKPIILVLIVISVLLLSGQQDYQVDAKEVNIYQLEGKPEVTCPTKELTIDSGVQGIINVRVQNVGSSNGMFNFGVSCDGSGGGSVTPSESLVNRNSEVSVDVKLTGTNLKSITNKDEIKSNCIFTAKDSAGVNKDSCDISLSIKSIEQCKSTDRMCSDDLKKVLVCNTKGDGFIEESACDYGCEMTATGAKCVTKSKEKNENLIFVGIIALFVLGVGAILYYLSNLIKKKKGNK